jgi:Protein of unknown function (DUF3105)
VGRRQVGPEGVRPGRLNRRALLLLNIGFAAGGVALLVVAAFAITGDGDSSSQRIPVPTSEPGPLRTTVREHSPVGRFEEAACRVRPHSADDPGRWFHPTENFYPPDGQAPTQADLDHLVNNDDAVVVIYRRSASRAAQEALQAWAQEGIGVVVAPSRSASAPPLEAYTATRRLTCDGIDLDQLTQFTDRHFTQPLRYEPHGERSGGGDPR